MCFPTGTPPHKQTFQEATPPPSSGKTFAYSTAVETIGRSVDRLFLTGSALATGENILHNESFWTNFLQSLQFDLSDSLVVYSRPHTEAEICFELLSPLLRRVGHSVSHIPLPEGSDIKEIVYSSALKYEVNTEDRGQRRRRRPQVDFTLSGQAGWRD